MNAQSYYSRKINNHNRIHSIVEIVGNYISEYQINEISENIAPAEELICQARCDGRGLFL
jgi:hypothetical protein